MEKLKLTVEQIRNYLGTNAKILRQFQGNNLFSELTNHNMINIIDDDFSGKLIVYRLSDIDKEIDVNGKRFIPTEELLKYDGELSFLIDNGEAYLYDICSLNIYPLGRVLDLYGKLLEWHFWPFGDEYFEQGLVIDKMIIKI